MDEAIRRTRRGITVKLEMTQKQELKLTPQMLQSMEILQMSTQELEAYLQELVQENPAAELSEPEERPDEGEELWRRMQSLADQDNQNRQYVAAEREELDPLARIGTDGGLEDTLLLHLSRQLERSQAPTLVLRGAQFLAACLDEAGYLREKVENLAQAAGLPAAVLEEGLLIAVQPSDIAMAYYQLAYVLWKAGRPQAGAACYLKSLMTSSSMAMQATAELQELVEETGVALPPREVVDEELAKHAVPVAPTAEVLEALGSGASAAVDVGMFPVARNLLALRLRYRPDDALVNVLRSLGE